MKLDPPTSKNLRRHGDSQLVFQLMMLGIAVLFWAAAKATDHPVMPSMIYGDWVTSIDAELWASSIMLASFVYLLGIMINGEWRYSPVLRLIGAAWHVVTLTAFITGAMGSQYGDPVVMMCIGAGGVHIWFVGLNIDDVRRSRRDRV